MRKPRHSRTVVAVPMKNTLAFSLLVGLVGCVWTFLMGNAADGFPVPLCPLSSEVLDNLSRTIWRVTTLSDILTIKIPVLQGRNKLIKGEDIWIASHAKFKKVLLYMIYG